MSERKNSTQVSFRHNKNLGRWSHWIQKLNWKHLLKISPRPLLKTSPRPNCASPSIAAVKQTKNFQQHHTAVHGQLYTQNIMAGKFSIFRRKLTVNYNLGRRNQGDNSKIIVISHERLANLIRKIMM